ncbi:hypothetical protein GPA19_24725 [Azoarcus indigens]|uniref:Uncharacterized protein n=1 Tax=Azoarcus indigens TaxID=29545 RepID=A0A4R6DC38_9RHOO|nr:hypothetical protein [Azoarcus indigens]NMG68138.1 hypothetical protein [Azoarcus indigens]TDN41890.1 hypothetical protein C7389_1591 [Azoarcus indigens]
MQVSVYFSDYFGVAPEVLDAYGAFNISLINDLPVFIDPFLLFNSDKPEYQSLHAGIIKYVRFLREISAEGEISPGLLRSWFRFPEVKQTWLGYSKVGNGGSGLGQVFSTALNDNLHSVFRDFGEEKITKSSHLEKLCLIKDGVGKDNISDFATNLIKGFLCEYTQKFAKQHLHANRIKRVPVTHTKFNYETRSWQTAHYELPFIDGDFVLLTPKDLLTKDEAWINKHDLIGDFDEVSESLPNEVLRSQVNEYLARQIPDDANQKDINRAVAATLRKFPELIDYYIKFKEDNGADAVKISDEKIRETESVFISQVSSLITKLHSEKNFYAEPNDTFDETLKRVHFLKQVIENNDGYRVFYVKGQPVKRESDLQLMFRLTWYAAQDDVNSEVNNGRGPVDYKISRGSKDSTLVEFKLASNSKLKQNLENQVAVYEAANQTKQSIKVIMCFSEIELVKTVRVLNELKLTGSKAIVVIDAGRDNKLSASNVKTDE